MLENCSSLMACRNCGVITSVWDCLNSSRGPIAMAAAYRLNLSPR